MFCRSNSKTPKSVRFPGTAGFDSACRQPARRVATAVAFPTGLSFDPFRADCALEEWFPPDAPSYLDKLGVGKWRFDPLEVPENGFHVPRSRGFALPDHRIFAKMGDSEPLRW